MTYLAFHSEYTGGVDMRKRQSCVAAHYPAEPITRKLAEAAADASKSALVNVV